MINSSSDESDDNEGEERCFQREVLNAIERNNYQKLHGLLNTDKFDINTVINAKDHYNKNNTLLHMALKKRKRNLDTTDSKKIINLLINKGANINIANDLGDTPYDIVNKRLKTGSQSGDWISVKNLFLLTQPSSSSQVRSSNYQTSKTIKNTVAGTLNKNKHHDSKMDCDESYSNKNPTYQTAGLKYSLHGVVYQLQLLMLFLRRATKTYDSFYFATEMNEAEKFDDVVLKYKKSKTDPDWTWRFLQAKHVLNVSTNRIQKQQLFSLNDKLPFSLHKYFLSFCKIKSNRFFVNSHLKDFIICTNAELDPNAKMYFTEDKCSKEDKILFFKSFTFKMFKLRTCATTTIRTNYETKLKNSVNNSYLNEFLEKFRFITNFPNEKQLNKLIKGELGKKYGLLNAELATNTFKSQVLKWLMRYKDGKSEYLLIKDGKEFLNLIEKQIRTLMTAGLSMAYPEKLSSYGIRFHNISDDITKFLVNKKKQILHLVSKSTLLTSIKVAKSLQYIDQYKARDSFIFVTRKQLLLNNVKDLIIDSFSSSISHNLLVISFESSKNIHKKRLQELYSNLSAILSNYEFKKLVTISFSNFDFNFGSGNNFMKIEDASTYKDFDDITQDNILKKEILFQGERIHLNQLINKCSACDIFDETILTEFMNDKEFCIGKSEISPFNLNIIASYLPRTLSRQQVQIKILHDLNFISNNTIFLTGASVKDLEDLNIRKDRTYVFNDNQTYSNGIILAQKDTTSQINTQIFQKLCENNDYENVFWVDYKDGKLAWKDFHRNIITFKTYVAKNIYLDYIKEDDLLQFKELNKKIYNIGGEPGIGKSAFTINLTRSLKIINPLNWIIRINLNEYTSSNMNLSGGKTLTDITFSEWETEKAIDFIADIIILDDPSKIEIYFQKKILQLALKKISNGYKYPNIIMIFDGFDEISPKYKDKTLVLLKALQNSNIFQLWITSRAHELFSLEEELKSPALHLKPFTEDEKIKYVTNVFHGCSQLNHNDLNTEDVLNSLCKYLEDIRLHSPQPDFLSKWKQPKSLEERLKNALTIDFTNNPLHLRMISEIMAKNKKNLSNNIDLRFLYSKFVDTKFDIYYNQKSLKDGSPAAMEMRERDLKILRKIHQNIALRELLPELCNEQNTEINECELVRVGFLILYQSGIRFVHRSFAEFFLSNYLEENFEDPNGQNILINFVLYKTGYSVIRKFLNNSNIFLQKLKTMKHNIFKRISDKDLYDCVKLLDVMIAENNENILKNLLINVVTNNWDFLKRTNTYLHGLYLKDLTEIYRKIILLTDVILYDTELFSVLFEDIIKHKNCFENFCEDESCLHVWAIYYSGSNSAPILDRIYSVAVENEKLKVHDTSDIHLKVFLDLFKKTCFAGESIIFKMAARGRSDLIQDLISWVKDKTASSCLAKYSLIRNVEEMYDNGMVYNDLRILACDSPLTSISPYSFQNFTYYILKNLILQTDIWGRNILHYLVTKSPKDCTAINSFLTILKLNFDQETITEFIVGSGKKTALLCESIEPDNESFVSLLKFALSNLELKTWEQLLLLKDSSEVSVLYYAALSEIGLRELLNFCINNFDTEFLKNVIISSSPYNNTVLHYVAKHLNTSKALIVLLEFVKRYFGLDELRNLIFQTDICGDSIFHKACTNESKVVEELLSYIKNNFGLETARTLIFKPNNLGYTGLHFAVENHFKNALSSFLNFAKANFDVAVLNDLILASNECEEGNALHLGARDNMSFCLFPETLELLLNFIQENFDVQYIFRLLLVERNQYGDAPVDITNKKKNIFSPFTHGLLTNLAKIIL